MLLASAVAVALARLITYHALSSANVKLLKGHVIIFQLMRLTVRMMQPVILNTVEQGYLCGYFFGGDLIILFSNRHGCMLHLLRIYKQIKFFNWNQPLSVFD